MSNFSSFAAMRMFDCYRIEGSEGDDSWAIQLDRNYRCLLSIAHERAGREEVWILRLERAIRQGAMN